MTLCSSGWLCAAAGDSGWLWMIWGVCGEPGVVKLRWGTTPLPHHFHLPQLRREPGTYLLLGEQERVFKSSLAVFWTLDLQHQWRALRPLSHSTSPVPLSYQYPKYTAMFSNKSWNQRSWNTLCIVEVMSTWNMLWDKFQRNFWHSASKLLALQSHCLSLAVSLHPVTICALIVIKRPNVVWRIWLSMVSPDPPSAKYARLKWATEAVVRWALAVVDSGRKPEANCESQIQIWVASDTPLSSLV